MNTRQKVSAFVVLALLLILDSRHTGLQATVAAMLEVGCLALLVVGFGRDVWRGVTERVKRNLWLNHIAVAEPDLPAQRDE
jgi:hypothetical protein